MAPAAVGSESLHSAGGDRSSAENTGSAQTTAVLCPEPPTACSGRSNLAFKLNEVQLTVFGLVRFLASVSQLLK